MPTRISDLSRNDSEFHSYKYDGDSEVAQRVVRGTQNSVYDNASFSVGTGIADYDVATNQSSLWDNVSAPSYISIRTDQTITVKLNAAANASITVTSADSPFILDGLLAVSNIYVTNSSGSTASISVFMV